MNSINYRLDAIPGGRQPGEMTVAALMKSFPVE
jgi:hypothetical protein